MQKHLLSDSNATIIYRGGTGYQSNAEGQQHFGSHVEYCRHVLRRAREAVRARRQLQKRVEHVEACLEPFLGNVHQPPQSNERLPLGELQNEPEQATTSNPLQDALSLLVAADDACSTSGTNLVF